MSALLSFQALVHAFSGSIGGAVSLAAFFPLDALRTRLQVGDAEATAAADGAGHSIHALLRLARSEGVPSLYRGLGAVVWTMAISNFIYFYAYSGLRNLWLAFSGAVAPSAAGSFVVAAAAGVLNVLLTTPLWLVNTRMKAVSSTSLLDGPRPYAGLLDGLVRVTNEEGLLTLWNGTLPSLLLVSSPTIQWMVYEKAKYVLQRCHGLGTEEAAPMEAVALCGLEFFLLGAVAKTVSTLMTYPLQLAQTKLRYSQGSGEPKKRLTGTLDCLRCTYQAHGFPGLFKGLEAKLWQTVLTAAFQLLVYEKIASALLQLW